MGRTYRFGKDKRTTKGKEKEEFDNSPILESSYRMSDDGKWIIHKTIITDIKPVSYLEKVCAPDEDGG